MGWWRHLLHASYVRWHRHRPRRWTKAWLRVVSIAASTRGWTASLLRVTLRRVVAGWRGASLGVHGWSGAIVVNGSTTCWGPAFGDFFVAVNIQGSHLAENLLFLVQICLAILAWERWEWAVTKSWLSWGFLRGHNGLS
jgi:hypothetical protein